MPDTHTTTSAPIVILLRDGAITTSAGLTYRLTPRLRYHNDVLQQAWACVGTGPDLWLPVPTTTPPEAA